MRRLRRSVRGISALEILIATVIAAILAFGIVALLFQGNHEAMVSEDYMFAEALAQRHLADAMSVPWDAMEEELPLKIPVVGLPPEDTLIGKLFEEYERNVEGPVAMQGDLDISLVEPGLMLFEISLTWPVRPGSKTLRRYSLIRLRSRKDVALSTNHPLLLPRPSPGGAS